MEVPRAKSVQLSDGRDSRSEDAIDKVLLTEHVAKLSRAKVNVLLSGIDVGLGRYRLRSARREFVADRQSGEMRC
jgi:hypothetical protein